MNQPTPKRAANRRNARPLSSARSIRIDLGGLLFVLTALVLFVGGFGSPARADTLVLANGDKINGEITEWAVDHVVIEHPQLGTLRFALDQLRIDTGDPPNPGLFGTRFLRGWTRRVDLGINGENNNGNTGSLTFGTKFAYKDDWTLWRFTGRYFYNISDDGDDDNNATASLSRHWLVPESHWFGSLAGRFQFDEFQAWKQRITISGGPGFHLVETDRHSLDLIVGPAYTREFGDSDANKAEALISLTYDWKVSERQSIDFANQYFNEVSPDAGDWRMFTTFAWSLKVTMRPALSLSLRVQNEFQSNPDAGDDKNDLKYFLTLGMDF